MQKRKERFIEHHTQSNSPSTAHCRLRCEALRLLRPRPTAEARRRARAPKSPPVRPSCQCNGNDSDGVLLRVIEHSAVVQRTALNANQPGPGAGEATPPSLFLVDISPQSKETPISGPLNHVPFSPPDFPHRAHTEACEDHVNPGCCSRPPLCALWTLPSTC
jgi:hypothetical protein